MTNWLKDRWASVTMVKVLIGVGLLLVLGLAGAVFRERLIDWLTRFWYSLTWTTILIALGLFLASVLFSAVLVGIVIVKVPANYFSSHYNRDFMPNSSWLTRWGAVIAKNIVGAILILAGIVMLIGPGQGILTIIIGLVMMDIPGKRPIEAKLISRPGVLAAVNSLRARYGKPALELD